MERIDAIAAFRAGLSMGAAAASRRSSSWRSWRWAWTLRCSTASRSARAACAGGVA